MKKFISRFKKPIIFTVLLVGCTVAYVQAQDVRGWLGHMFFNQASPQIRYDGTLTFRNLAATTTYFTIDTGTRVSKIANYRQTLTPVAWTNSGSSVFISTATTQSFTVTGLAVTDIVFINGPAPTAGCAVVGGKVLTADTLTLDIINTTTLSCIPAVGVYSILAIRT